MAGVTGAAAGVRWLVLIYQFSQGPGSRRVKIWRRLQDIGAVAIKNSAYVLPFSEQTQEDFEWLLAELSASGADAALLEARFIDGMNDAQVQELFNAARDTDYAQLVQDADALLTEGARPRDGAAESARRSLQHLRRRLGQIEALDYFAAAGHNAAQAALQSLATQLESRAPPMVEEGQDMNQAIKDQLQGRVWVTRRNVRVDRIASAWLIRRWIDPAARFRFVAAKNYRPAAGEIRFDMFDAEFTHEGDRCTFEVLVRQLDEPDPALQCIAEIVHDIDLKDTKFGRPETDGVASLLTGLVASQEDDDERLERGAGIFENLYTYFEAAAR